MSDFCLVRQPVFGTSGALVGYEIRFRDLDDGQHAFVQSFLSGTFDLVRGNQPAFVACTRRQLLENAFQVVDPASAILVLPRTLGADPEVIDAIVKYREAGGSVALDELTDREAPSEALLSYASWVRVAMRGDVAATVARLRQRVAPFESELKVVVDQIETAPHFAAAQQVGALGFQGRFFSSPEPVAAADLPMGTMSAMRLMGLARDPNVNDRKLEDVIATDPVLTIQLLRLVNSAAVGMRGVSSIGQALRLIGRNTFQRWLAVAVAASRKSTTAVDQELVRQAVERGRFLEQLGGGPREPGTLFLVGLFSLLDAVFRMSISEILERVVLSDEATAALVERTGPYADALSFAESYEMGLFENASELAREMGVDPSRIGELYTNAVGWTNEALAPMTEAQPAGR
ncbi:MAG: HDOD domain-containing protein [Gemmatimonadaceae bacterium]|nr:HDOD domain-containing protein [Gemmatimonadaceae bacterium]